MKYIFLTLLLAVLVSNPSYAESSTLQKRLHDKELLELRKQQNSIEYIEQLGRDTEALFTQQVLKDIYSSVPFDPLIKDTSSQQIYRQLLIEEISKQMSKKNGIGIASKISDDLNKRLKINAKQSDQHKQSTLSK